MKKIFFGLIMSLFIGTTLVSCGNAEEKMVEKYTKACADGDFDKARGYVTEMEGELDSYSVNRHNKYINDKEIYNLLAHPSRDNDNRIMFLFNTYETSAMPNMADVMEVAISQENENLATKLIKAGVVPTNDAVKNAANNEMDNLVDLILDKYPDRIVMEELAKYYADKNGQEALMAKLSGLYESHTQTMYDARVATLAKKYGFMTLVDKILIENPSIANNSEFKSYTDSKPEFKEQKIKLLRSKIATARESKPTVHRAGLVDYYDGLYYSHKESYEEDKYLIEKENAAIKNYNNKLLPIYNEALEMGDKKIANEVLAVMMPVIEAYSGSAEGEMIHGVKVDGNHYLIYYNYDEINRLKDELNNK